MTRLFAFVAALAAAVVLSAQTLAPERLARIDRFFQDQVDRERIGGAVTLVLQDGKPVYQKAFGWAEETGRKMAVDAIFRIASQSKAITSAVILSTGKSSARPRPRSARGTTWTVRAAVSAAAPATGPAFSHRPRWI